MDNNIQDEMIIPYHLGIIMDGNGRWAQTRGLPRSAGHQAGVQSLQKVVEACSDLGIQMLTIYVFSTENWNRPSEEVNYLMHLAQEYSIRELPNLKQNGIRVQQIGKRDGLPTSLLEALDLVIQETRENSRLYLNLALNYGGRVEIIDAVKKVLESNKRNPFKEKTLEENVFEKYLYYPQCPDVDLVIRTGGEQRLSNFLLWQTANSIFLNTAIKWPDFQKEHLQEAIHIYSKQMVSYQTRIEN